MTRRHLTGWKRRGSGSQVTLSARCSEHESELLHSIVSSMRELLVERSESAPVDEPGDDHRDPVGAFDGAP